MIYILVLLLGTDVLFIFQEKEEEPNQKIQSIKPVMGFEEKEILEYQKSMEAKK
ncbi:MAG: hypothetical protein AABX13_04345 [Nanoarchaeota archaeon]